MLFLLRKNGNFADGLDYWTGIDGGTITLDNDIRYNGEPSINVYTTTQNYSGIGNDYQIFEENKYPYGHDYLFHACFYKDSESPNGGVNQPIRMYIGVISSQGTNKYIGISAGTQNFTYIKDRLKEKEWVCFTEVLNLPDNGLDNKTNKSLRIDNHNQGLINNFWVADVQLRITDRVQYTYNTAITNFPFSDAFNSCANLYSPVSLTSAQASALKSSCPLPILTNGTEFPPSFLISITCHSIKISPFLSVIFQF